MLVAPLAVAGELLGRQRMGAGDLARTADGDAEPHGDLLVGEPLLGAQANRLGFDVFRQGIGHAFPPLSQCA
jgi:hypothetical protein